MPPKRRRRAGQNENVTDIPKNTQRRVGSRPKRTCQERLNVNQSCESRSEKSRSRRPQIINLDVTFSSEDEDNLPITPSPPPSTYDDLVYSLTPSPPKSPTRSVSNDISEIRSNTENIGMNTASEKSENECDLIHSSSVPKKCKEDIAVYDGNSSSDDEDPFAIDYVATKKRAMEKACRDIDIVEKEERRQKEIVKEYEFEEKKLDVKIPPSDIAEQPELEAVLIIDTEKEKKKHTDHFFSELGISPIDIISPSKKRVKMSRKTKKALDQFQKLRDNNLEERLNAKDDDDTDVLIVSDEEVDPNAEQTIRIRWGQETLKYTLRRLQKFFIIYQQLAETNDVSVSKVLLCHKDRIVSPESCPADLGVTVADILEGGIQNSRETKESIISTSVNVERSSDSIELKVQNANSKNDVKIYLSKYDKIAVLMHKYAEEMRRAVKDFKFMFDGEMLKSDDTPVSLDLDGGECIDVYEM